MIILNKEDQVTLEELKHFLEVNETRLRGFTDDKSKEAHRKFERWFDLLEGITFGEEENDNEKTVSVII